MTNLIARLRARRRQMRDLWDGLAILRSDNYAFLKFAPPGHFYSPLPDMTEVLAQSTTLNNCALSDIQGIDLNVAGQLELVRRFAACSGDFAFPDNKADGYRYYLDNGFFSYGDAAALFGMMRLFAPKRIIEVGSGFSSALMLDVNDRFFEGRAIDFTFIEPFPIRLRTIMREADLGACRIVEERVQRVPREIFSGLEENDLLFIDSSHVAKAGSDVLDILFSILPILRPGVLIHFHDILWPFEYPHLWLKEGRAWNEAYFVRAFLQYNEAFAVMFFNSYLEVNHAACLRDCLPVMLSRPSSRITPGNTSLWLRKIS